MPPESCERLDLVKEALQQVAKRLRAKPKHIYSPLRFFLTGRRDGPGVPEIIVGIGQEWTLRRLQKAVDNVHIFDRLRAAAGLSTSPPQLSPQMPEASLADAPKY